MALLSHGGTGCPDCLDEVTFPGVEHTRQSPAFTKGQTGVRYGAGPWAPGVCQVPGPFLARHVFFFLSSFTCIFILKRAPDSSLVNAFPDSHLNSPQWKITLLYLHQAEQLGCEGHAGALLPQ